MPTTVETDILILGSGGAGLFAALHAKKAAPDLQVTVAVKGLLGRDVDVGTGQRAAELCAINILAQAKAALGGDLGRIVRVVKLNGFVASEPSFTEQHLIINGASNLIAEVLGERGKHARAAVGMACLPLNASVEIDAVIEIG